MRIKDIVRIEKRRRPDLLYGEDATLSPSAAPKLRPTQLREAESQVSAEVGQRERVKDTDYY
jgi:hypothetical protein